MITFQQIQALTSHFESFWSIVHLCIIFISKIFSFSFQGVFCRYGKNSANCLWTFWTSHMFGKVWMQYHFRLLHCFGFRRLHGTFVALECQGSKHCGGGRNAHPAGGLNRTWPTRQLCGDFRWTGISFVWVFRYVHRFKYRPWQPNWKFDCGYSTYWKFCNFPATLIFREMNFVWF